MLSDVLRPTTGPWQHWSSALRQHARGFGNDHQRLQHRTNDLLRLVLVCRASFVCNYLVSVNVLRSQPRRQLISKKLGPDNWIPIQMVTWSIVACCQAKLNSRGAFFATRCLLGLIEGGFIPDMILYLSYFYKTKELPFRLSLFWTSCIATKIVSAFLAFGILRLRGFYGMAGWRWLFALEGGLTSLIGIISWYVPPTRSN